jgi:hypothetical protein
MGGIEMKNARVAISIFITTIIAIGVWPAGALTTAQVSLSGDPAKAGEWSAPFSEGGLFDSRPPSTQEEAKTLPTAVSMAVSPDGTIIYWNGQEWEDVNSSAAIDLPHGRGAQVRVLDLRAYLKGEGEPTWSTPEQERGIGGDLFCSDLRNLADGRIMVVGGTRYENLDEDLGLPEGWGRTEAWGLDSARVYDPVDKSWTPVDPMNHRRWYPSLVTLPDGKLFVAGGTERVIYNDLTYVNETETFDPRTGRWTDNGASGKTALPYFARLHLLPNGKVFYDGTGQMWGPLGPTRDMAEWNLQKVYDPETKSWTVVGPAPLGGRSSSFSAMLPLEPPYDNARIVIAGGVLGPATPGSYLANNITEIVDVNGDSVERRLGPPLKNPRWYSSGVVLPSGEVIAVNGGDKDDGFMPHTTSGVRQAEMFDGERWVPLASAARDRGYHNTAVLLGDGSILVGGHAPLTGGPGNANYFPGLGLASNFRDPSFEVFKPPYLFRGSRPRLVQVQSGVGLGETFKITTPDAAKITSVVLSRLPAVTHLADADQRTVKLQFSQSSSGTIQAVVPEDAAVALPGHYYLFLMSDNGQGPTPSRAAIVQIGGEDKSQARLPFGI